MGTSISQIHELHTRLGQERRRLSAELERLEQERKQLFERGARQSSNTLVRMIAMQIHTVDQHSEQVLRLLEIVERQYRLLAHILYAQEVAARLDVNPLAYLEPEDLLSAAHGARGSAPERLDRLTAVLGVLEEKGRLEAQRAPAAMEVRQAAGQRLLSRSIPDGDGVNLQGGVRVRYIGIDAPEMRTWSGEREPFAEEAREFNRRLVEGKPLRLVADTSETDPYGRLLRYVYVGDTFVNAELVKAGLARVLTLPPDTHFARVFERLEAEARQAKRGMWGLG